MLAVSESTRGVSVSVQAVGDVCEYIGKCTQPVCSEDTMYNNTKVDVVAMHTLHTAQLKQATVAAWHNPCVLTMAHAPRLY